MKNLVVAELKKEGLYFESGMYANLTNIILDAIELANEFGYDVWVKTTTLGYVVKQIVAKLSNNA